MAENKDTILNEMLDVGYDYHTSIRMLKELQANDPDYLDTLLSEEELDYG